MSSHIEANRALPDDLVAERDRVAGDGVLRMSSSSYSLLIWAW